MRLTMLLGNRWEGIGRFLEKGAIPAYALMIEENTKKLNQKARLRESNQEPSKWKSNDLTATLPVSELPLFYLNPSGSLN